jgi:ribonuclease P protein component
MPNNRHTFPKSRRLCTRPEVSAVFDARVSESRGPLVMYALPNRLSHLRLALVIGRRVGSAVRRNRIKRLLREAFRVHQHDLPATYDLVIVVRPHGPMILAEYQKLLTHLLLRLHRAWSDRQSSQAPP